MKNKKKVISIALFFLILIGISIFISHLRNQNFNEERALAVGLRGDVSVTKELSSFQKERLKKYFTETPVVPAHTGTQSVVNDVQAINQFNQSQTK